MDQIIEILKSMNGKEIALAALLPILGSLLLGRFIKRLFVMPFKWIANKTPWAGDDQLVKDAEHDLDLEK